MANQLENIKICLHSPDGPIRLPRQARDPFLPLPSNESSPSPATPQRCDMLSFAHCRIYHATRLGPAGLISNLVIPTGLPQPMHATLSRVIRKSLMKDNPSATSCSLYDSRPRRAAVDYPPTSTHPSDDAFTTGHLRWNAPCGRATRVLRRGTVVDSQ